jgi:hypothetical protein
VRSVFVLPVDSLQGSGNCCLQSVFHLTYLRQLFPEDSYNTKRMKHLDNMDIRLLKSDFEDGQCVKAWMVDVQEALTLGYLHKLHFCVAKDDSASNVIEQYSYTFSYDASGATHFVFQSWCF